MAADLAKGQWGESLRLVKVEYRRRAVVRGGVVGRPRKRCGTRPVFDQSSIAGVLERGELGKPSRQHGTQPTPRRHAQEAVALAKLTVLVAAAGDERLLETEASHVERDDVQMVVCIDQERRAVRGARRRDTVEAGNDLGRLVEHG